jgi:hypothetical protein
LLSKVLLVIVQRPDYSYFMKSSIVAIVLSGAWIGASEFLRNEVLFKFMWLDHYAELGVIFPSQMINNAVWGIWSFLLAGMLVFLWRQNFGFWKTALVSWIMAFVLMWLTIGNLGVLPFALLFPAIPLSMVEIVVALWIISRISVRPGERTD